MVFLKNSKDRMKELKGQKLRVCLVPNSMPVNNPILPLSKAVSNKNKGN
jgi:hypothetical protein